MYHRTLFQIAAARRRVKLELHKLAKELLVVESECFNVINALKLSKSGLARSALLANDILSFASGFQHVCFSFVRREGNVIAHHLTK